MKRIYRLLAVALVAGAAACTTENLDDAAPRTPIINTDENAIEGEILVKFRPEISALLDRAQTRATRAGVVTRTDITTVDELMRVIGGYELERVFPVDSRNEDRTRASGLHLWYIVRFDKSNEVGKVAEELARLGEVSKVEFNREIKRAASKKAVPLDASEDAGAANDGFLGFDDPELGRQWHYINNGNPDFMPHMAAGADVNCAEAWKICKGDPSVIVAVMDEGVMWSHEDLNANMWVNEGEEYRSDKDADGNGYAGDKYGYNFAANTGVITWDDVADTGHGTHIAGTIAAVNNNGKGVCGIAGGDGTPNSGVKIMSVQMFSGDSGATIPNEARAIKYAADNGAVILQCSWGMISSAANPLYYSRRGPATDEEYEESSSLEKEAFDYFIYNAGSPNGVIDGGLVVFASGNEFAPKAAYPGAYKDFVCVSALAADYTPSTFSNYGPGVDISAPGGDTEYHENERGGVLSTMPEVFGGPYGYMDGTSMSCPHVAGVAALGLSYAAKLHKHFDSRQFRELLLRSARSIDDRLVGYKTYNYSWGSIGELCPTREDLTKYRYKMGGIIDAALLLKNIESEGTAIALPNVYVAAGATQRIDLTHCFRDGETASFTASSDNTSIATVAVEGRSITVTGVAVGSASFTVTSSTGESQTACITVRKTANDNGWL